MPSQVMPSPASAMQQPVNPPAVSLKAFLHLKAGTIGTILSKGIYEAKHMLIPTGCFDFMSAKGSHIIAYNNMLWYIRIDVVNSEKDIERHILVNYADQLSYENHALQVRNLARYIMCLYLNYIQCPSDFWNVFPDKW